MIFVPFLKQAYILKDDDHLKGRDSFPFLLHLPKSPNKVL